MGSADPWSTRISVEILAVVCSAWAHPTHAPPDLALFRPPVVFSAWVHPTHVPPKLVGNGFETRFRRDVDESSVQCQTPIGPVWVQRDGYSLIDMRRNLSQSFSDGKTVLISPPSVCFVEPQHGHAR